MDMKEQSLLNYYYKKLSEGTFDEKDLYGFLLLIRNQGKDIRWINEVTEFVLNRGQHNGLIMEYLLETRKKFEGLGRTKSALRIEDVFSFKEIKAGLNKVLADCQLEPLANERINDFVTCLISILQQISIVDESDREIGKLFFAISNKQVILMAEIEVAQNLFKKTNAVFPVLTANNGYADIKKQDRFDTPYLFVDKVVEVTNKEGKMEIIIP
ncbi:hypothetical protein QE429_004625 [Bacillus sp. SORGH_AS 510]|uniref:hypothetical protein n=1 Tax=Bacillus sp. SORGH_AS_0510 TaxID=3041771 RepID=UPI00278A30BD|nr:hypothetical protein [Bacillus sp. SORGH_AS_0510]MDQ1147798.1 hypothetical protein [Bacillus sp. SORGH_AS_0510]